MTDNAILRFNRDLLFEIETDGTPEGSIVTAPFSGTIPGGGPVLSFESKVETVIPLIVDINPFQEGSGDPSPDNVRPISGYDTVIIHVSPTTTAGDGTTYPIPLGQTVYGGTLDVVSGVLTIDKVGLTFNGSEDWWTNGAVDYFGLSSVPNSYDNNDRTQLANWLVGGGSGYTTFGSYRTQTNGVVAVGNNESGSKHWDSVATFKTYLQSHNLTIVYKVQTPTEIQLTPTEVKTLIGWNNIWSNSGDVYAIISTENVTYKITGGAEDVQRFDKIWRALLLYRDGGLTDRYKNLSGKGVEIISHGPAILKED